MIKKIWDELSILSIRTVSEHNLTWLDVEKNIYNEYSTKRIIVRFCGIKIMDKVPIVKTKHKILDKSKKVGFTHYGKTGK